MPMQRKSHVRTCEHDECACSHGRREHRDFRSICRVQLARWSSEVCSAGNEDRHDPILGDSHQAEWVAARLDL
jgi:hypothetical protein